MRKLLGASVIVAAVFVACGEGGRDRAGDGGAAQTAPTSRGATTVPRLTAPTSAGSPTTTTATVPSVRRANANVASQAELTAALQANGVEDAATWAADIIENRPYATNDPSFAKVRQNLAEDDLSADAIEKIVASLSL